MVRGRVQGTPTVLIARTDADSATLLTSDIDDGDKAFCTGERTPEGFFKVRSGVEVSSPSSQKLPAMPVPCTLPKPLPISAYSVLPGQTFLPELSAVHWSLAPRT